MKKAWIILRVLILSLLLTFPAGAADSTAFNPVPISITATAVSVPVGTVISWPSSSLPPLEGGIQKWSECNGQNLPQAAYPELFATIGTNYGGGGATFQVPDLRGEFIRGWDHGKGVDAGRTIASAQSDEIRSHSHAVIFSGSLAGTAGMGFDAGFGYKLTAGSGSATATGGAETRPRNVSMMYVIRTLP